MSRRKRAVIESIQVGQPRTLGRAESGDPFDRPWSSAFHKHSVTGPVRVHRTNMAGDTQADLVNHGGPDKALLVYSTAHVAAWRRELPRLDVSPGAFGENLTVAGLDERSVCIGDVYRFGGVLAQVSQPRSPCWKLARRHRQLDLAARVDRNGRSGWYLRVLEEGEVCPRDEFALLERHHPMWTVARTASVMRDRHASPDLIEELSQLTVLSAGWRHRLERRLETTQLDEPLARLIGPNVDVRM